MQMKQPEDELLNAHSPLGIWYHCARPHKERTNLEAFSLKLLEFRVAAWRALAFSHFRSNNEKCTPEERKPKPSVIMSFNETKAGAIIQWQHNYDKKYTERMPE